MKNQKLKKYIQNIIYILVVRVRDMEAINLNYCYMNIQYIIKKNLNYYKFKQLKRLSIYGMNIHLNYLFVTQRLCKTLNKYKLSYLLRKDKMHSHEILLLV